MNNIHPIHISDADVQLYHDLGYFRCQQKIFPEEKFRRLQAYFEELLEDLPTDKLPEHMDVPHFTFPALFEWLLADEVLDFVERFIGPDIILWSSHFICKSAGDGREVPWHEDSSYWQGRLDPQETITIWLAIDESVVENGCMRVIPGTHHDGFSEYEPVPDPEHSVFPTRIQAGQFCEEEAVDLVLKPGECHVHDGRLIHGSNPNSSTKRRCGYTMRYMPGHVKHTPDPRGTQAIYLARGHDLAGNDFAEPGEQFKPGMKRWG